MSRPTFGPDLNPRARLLRDLVLLLLLTSGGILLSLYLAGSSLKQELALNRLAQVSGKTREQFSGYFQPARQVLSTAKDWGEAGALSLDDSAALAGRFIPVLRNMPQSAALVLGDEQGRSFYLSRFEQHWRSRSLDGKGSGQWQHWDDQAGLQSSNPVADNFDPRSRPWYKGAEGKPEGQFHWTLPYLFHTQQITGITAAVSFRHQGRYVIGLDLPLDGILSDLAGFHVGNAGSAFLLDQQGNLLLPRESPDDIANSGFPVALSERQLKLGALLSATEVWHSTQPVHGEAFNFQHNGDWWASVTQLGNGKDHLWLGVALPEGDFLGAVQAGWQRMLMMGLLLLAVGAALVIALSRRYGAQLRNLPTLSVDPELFEQRVMSLIRSGESPTLEFKSTLRTNLAKGKPGKEIELAWLKGVVGFLNTDGGILLVGVSDEGELLGLDADGFENDDKCLLHFKNLINQHIGAEYARYIQAELQAVQGKQVLAISCEKAPDPVFLMIGKNEEFHIRSGPSSMKLTPRQMLQYLGRR